MARTAKSAKLDTKTARLKIKPGSRVQEPLNESGKYLVYYRPKGGAGTWKAYFVNTRDKSVRKMKPLGMADDCQNANGEDILTYSQAKKAALNWFAIVENSILDGEPIQSGSLTVADALNDYFQDGERRGMKGLTRARMSAAAWILPKLGSIEVAKLTRKRLENWLDWMAASPCRLRVKAGFPPAYASPPTTDDERRARKDSANRILAILKAALNFAYNKDLIHTDPCWQKVKPYRGTTSARVRFLQPDEAARLVNVCPPDFKDLVRGALLTGCRYGELTRLQCKDYNPNNEIATIFIADSKSGKPRHVILTPEGVRLFDEMTAKRQSPNDLIFTREFVNRHTQGRDSKGKFVNTNQKTISSWGHSHQTRFMKAACLAAGLEYISFHELRHTYASMLVSKGLNIMIVAEQLGHTDTRMVEKHYGHLKASYKAEMFNAAMPTLGIVEPPQFQKLKIKA
jgi:integrase